MMTNSVHFVDIGAKREERITVRPGKLGPISRLGSFTLGIDGTAFT
jgi:hypothetical protein